MMRITPKKTVLWVSLLLFAIVLLQNSDPTPLELLFWQVQMPLFILILSTLFIGCTIGWLTHLAYAKGRKSVTTQPQTPK
ncbi:MAG: lipopolysaccharide assembly protein LapA domain-containing protein, partial [bacterium]